MKQNLLKSERNIKNEILNDLDFKKSINEIIDNEIKKRNINEKDFDKLKMLVDYVLYQDNLFYFIYSIFIAVNGILLSTYSFKFGITFELLIPIFGIILCILWILVNGRVRAWRDTILFMSKKLRLKMVDNNLDIEFIDFWMRKYNNKEFKLFYRGLTGDCSAIRFLLGSIYLFLAMWICILTYNFLICCHYNLIDYIDGIFLFIILLCLEFFFIDNLVRVNRDYPEDDNEKKEEPDWKWYIIISPFIFLIIFLIIELIRTHGF